MSFYQLSSKWSNPPNPNQHTLHLHRPQSPRRIQPHPPAQPHHPLLPLPHPLILHPTNRQPLGKSSASILWADAYLSESLFSDLPHILCRKTCLRDLCSTGTPPTCLRIDIVASKSNADSGICDRTPEFVVEGSYPSHELYSLSAAFKHNVDFVHPTPGWSQHKLCGVDPNHLIFGDRFNGNKEIPRGSVGGDGKVGGCVGCAVFL